MLREEYINTILSMLTDISKEKLNLIYFFVLRTWETKDD